jgi:hypothetical protein
MSDQPPDRSRIAEIDIGEIIAGPDPDHHPAPAKLSDGSYLRNATAFPEKSLRRYDARVGWSGWTNVIFAALTAIGTLFFALRGFEPQESSQRIRLHPGEYIYPQPRQSNEGPSQGEESTSGSGRESHLAKNVSSTANRSEQSQSGDGRSFNPSSPPNPGSSNGNHSSSGDGSARGNDAAGSKSAASKSVQAKKSTAARTRRIGLSRTNKASCVQKNSTVNTASAHSGSQTSSGPAKAGQTSISHSINGASRLGTGSIRGMSLRGGMRGR